MKEIWKDIPAFEGIYQISNFGRVLSIGQSWKVENTTFGIHKRKPKILKNQIDKDGYEYIHLWKKHKQNFFHIHTLVARNFVPNPENKYSVNHKNGIRTDNRASNLEWLSIQENIIHAYKVLHRKPARHTRVQCVETGKIYSSITEAAKEHGITAGTICGALAKRVVGKYVVETAAGYHWKRI